MNNPQIAIIAGILMAQKPKEKQTEPEYISREEREENLEVLMLSI